MLFSERERAGHDTTCPSPWFTSLGQSPFELERSLVTANQATKGNTTDKGELSRGAHRCQEKMNCIHRFRRCHNTERAGPLPALPEVVACRAEPECTLSPSSHKLSDEFISSGLSAALGHEPFGLELMAERLGPNGGSHRSNLKLAGTTSYLRIEALRQTT